MNESAILGTKLSVQVTRCVTWRIARCYDADALFKVHPHTSSPFACGYALSWFGVGWCTAQLSMCIEQLSGLPLLPDIDMNPRYA